MTSVPDFPRVTVTIHPDASGEVTIQGISHPIPARADVPAARQAALGMVTLRAAIALGRPVRVTAHDPDGIWPLVVHPDGHVTAAGTHHSPAEPAPDRTFRLRTRDGRTSEPTRSALIGRNPQPADGETVQTLFAIHDTGRQVSKTHARLDIDDRGSVTVTDRDSTNGTAIRLHGTRRPLRAGASLVLPHEAALLLGDLEILVEPLTEEAPR